MDQVTSSPNTLHGGDRRRYPRKKPTSLIYVELDVVNGGIVLDLGIGGLAFQGADKLPDKQELILKFRLGKDRPGIEAVGRIAWLAPTQKEAGIYFKSLTDDASHEIADWIATQKKPHESPATASPATRNVFARSVPVMPHLTQQEDVQTRGVSPKQAPVKLPNTLLENATSIELDSTKAPAAPKDILKAGETRLGEDTKNVPKRQWVLPASLSPSRRAPKEEVPLSSTLFASRLIPRGRRRAVLIACAMSVAGILTLILAFAYFGASPDGGRLPQAPTIPAGPAVPGESETPTPHTQATVRPYPRSAWTTFLQEIFSRSNDNDKKNLGRDQANVQVWISKRSGYYYCDGSADYGSAPGAVMAQGEALQSGYQPKLGSYCY